MTSMWQRVLAGTRRLPPPVVEGPTPRRRRLLIGLALGLTLVVAFSGNFTLDFAQGTRGFAETMRLVMAVPFPVSVLSALLLWVALLALIAVTGRVIVSCCLFLAGVVAIAFANHAKITLRQEPIYPTDLTFLGQPGFLLDMVDAQALVLTALLVVGLPLVAVLASRALRRRLPRIDRRREPRLWVGWVVGRVCVLLLAPLLTWQLAGFNDGHNPVHAAYSAAGVGWAQHSQRRNYVRNGMVAGFLYNLRVPAMLPPPGYSAATMAQVAKRWRAVARRVDARLSPSALDGVNVVVVLSETLSDPTRVEGVGLGEDPLRFTRRLMRRTPSGSMLTQTIGGGTANAEFEVLTGFSLAQYLPQMTTPYQMLVTGQRSFPSAVSYFKRRGDEAVAVHPYRSRMYRRDVAYPVLGFDEFVDDDAMTVPRNRIDENSFISDDSALRQAEAELEQSDEPLFLQLVTMQNHYPYTGKYDDPVRVTGASGETADQLGGYARGLSHTDDALKAFIQRLRRSDEKTVVLLYGDHTPAFWASTSYATRQRTTLRQTPFLMWSNYRTLQPKDFGVTSATYLLPLLLRETGQALPPFYAMLLALRRAIPAAEQDLAYTGDGFAPRVRGLDAREQRILDDYRLVQYDLSVGERYSLRSMLDLPATR